MVYPLVVVVVVVVVDCFFLRHHCAECFEQHALLSVQTFDVTLNVLFVYHMRRAIHC